jgi:Arginine deiminase
MGVEALTVIGTGVDPPAATQRQWDDGGNALAVDRRLMLCYERNVETNARLEAAGVEVIRIPGSELSRARGGPRALSSPVSRDSVAAAAPAPAAAPALTLVSGGQAAAAADLAAPAPETAAPVLEVAELVPEVAELVPEVAALAPAEAVAPVATAEEQTATMAGLATH